MCAICTRKETTILAILGRLSVVITLHDRKQMMKALRKKGVPFIIHDESFPFLYCIIQLLITGEISTDL